MLKSYNSNNVGVVKLHCVECNKDSGGSNGDHSKTTVNNLFANFRKSHILSYEVGATHRRESSTGVASPFAI
jgi:hypothetical protein